MELETSLRSIAARGRLSLAHVERFELSDALDAVWEAVRHLNRLTLLAFLPVAIALPFLAIFLMVIFLVYAVRTVRRFARRRNIAP